MRYFNTEGLCRPEEHYMVRLDDRMEQIQNYLLTGRNILSSTGDGNMEERRR